MRPPDRKIPNPLTMFRLLALPVLWLLALVNWRPALALGLALAALSDVLDGRLAKRDPRFTNGNLDSVADKLLTLSAVAWLVLLEPEVFTEHPGLILAATLLYSVSLVLGWRKHGRVTRLHTHLGKLGGLAQAIFVFHAFLSQNYSPALFYVAIGLFLIAVFEEFLIQLVYAEIDEETVRSIIPFVVKRFGRRNV